MGSLLVQIMDIERFSDFGWLPLSSPHKRQSAPKYSLGPYLSAGHTGHSLE